MAKIAGVDRAEVKQRGDAYSSMFTSQIRSTLQYATTRMGEHPVADDLGVIMGEWTRRVDDQLLPHLGDTYMDSVHRQRRAQRDALVSILKPRTDALVAAPSLTGPFEIPPVNNDAAIKYMETARNRLVNVGNEVWQHARDQLIEGINAGEEIGSLKTRVTDATGLASPRADTIARTEVNGAMNAGSLSQMKQIATPMTKEWLAVGDGRTRVEHAEADGQVVGINEMFDVGGEPWDAPGDVNCRCTLGFNVPDDDLVNSTCGCDEGQDAILASIVPAALTAAPSGPIGRKVPPVQEVNWDLSSVCACSVDARLQVNAVEDETALSSAYNASRLDVDQLDAVQEYSEKAYRQINKQLREGKTIGVATKQVRQLDSAFKTATALKKPTVSYRGVKPNAKLPYFSKTKSMVGVEWEDPAFVSSSAFWEVAENFSPDEGILLRIYTPKGVKVLDLSSFDEVNKEGELLLGRRTRFRVIEDHGMQDLGSYRRHRVLDVEVIK